MRPGFLPVKDLDLLAWGGNFAEHLSSDPIAYGVSPADAAGFASLQAAFAATMVNVEPPVRSRVHVVAKNEARLALENDARRLNALVRGSGIVDEAGLITLGLTVYKKNYRRIGPPVDLPSIYVCSVIGRRISLRLTPLHGSKFALPGDVTGAAIYQWIGEGDPPTELSRWTLALHATRARVAVEVNARPGTKVHFVAYYLNRRGERGPLGPTSYTYAMGGMKAPSLMAA